MHSRSLIWIAVAEGLLVLVLGLMVATRATELPASSEGTGVAQERNAAPPVSVEQTTPKSDAPRSESAPVPDSPAVAAETVAADDPLGVVLYGTVRDETGKVLPGPFVSLTAADPERKLQLQSWSERYPTWSLAGIPPGKYHLRCGYSGFVPFVEDVELEATPRVQRRDLVLVRMLAVKVRLLTPEGQPLTGFAGERQLVATEAALPDLIPGDGDHLPFQTLGSWHGNHDGSMGEGIAGQIVLLRPPPLYLNVMRGPVCLQSLHLEQMRNAVTFTIDPEAMRRAVGGLRFRVVDAATGLAITAAQVRVANCGTNVNAQGGIDWSSLPPGNHDLTIWTEHRYATVARSIQIRQGEVLDLGTIGLVAPRKVSGIVVDQSGQGVVASVLAMPLQDAQAPVFSPMLGIESRADGRFDLGGLVEGRYLLRATTRDGSSLGMTTAEPGGAQEVRIVLSPTFPVRLASRLTVYQECRATIRNAEGQVVRSDRLLGSANVEFRLPVGPYVLELTGAGHEGRRSFSVTQQGATLDVP